MAGKKVGKTSLCFPSAPEILSFGNAVGKQEGKGPLGAHFDYISWDDTFGEKSWEKSEVAMGKKAFSFAKGRSKLSDAQPDLLFGGDLLNQCTATSHAMRESGLPYLGLYGACSTLAESLILAAMSLDGDYGETAGVLTSSHFCSAERQYRLPLEYGGQRSPTAQWTATAAGCVLLGRGRKKGPRITHATIGKICDMGVHDNSNMGAAMAGAAYETLCAHFSDTQTAPADYDAIVTGDLGRVGHDILLGLCQRAGLPLQNSLDCGMLLYQPEEQDVHAGGSGCGCSAAVLTAYFLPQMMAGRYRRLLFCGTGALHSPTTVMQGESIPGICHAVALSI